MRGKVKLSVDICRSCKYHMGFGSQPGKQQIDEGHCKNVACNYMQIEKHSRIFKNGKMAYDPKYCDKYEEGDAISLEEWREPTFEMHSVMYRKNSKHAGRWHT